MGGLSAFLSRFSSSGVLLWGTYYHATVGIAGAPHLFEDIACDASGNVYAATGSGINSPYLVTPNAFQTQSNGNGDALLVKFNPSGQRLWATYYGGSATETAYGVACDNDQNVYITGQTGSLSDIATPGSWQSSCNNCQGGQSDGFLAKFDSSGNRIWATYFGGPSGDVLWRVKCDADDNVHAVGHTISFSDIASPGCHQPVHGNPLNPSQFDGMLIKFDSAGQRLWSTYYGGEGYDSFGDIAVKDNRRVYLAGVTTSNSNIATDTMYATPPNSIYSHMFLAEFDSSGQRIYATYYGGANHDGASSVAYSLTAGHIYMAGVSASANLATAGSYQVNNNLGPGTQAYDGLIVCFHDSSSTLNTPTVGGLLCTGSSYNIINNAVGYFGPGNSFTVQLSDPSGSFSNPTVIGSSNTTTGGVISCFIPAGISPGLNYRIRIVSSHPIAYSTVSGSIQIAHPTSAVVSITVSPGSAVPAGAAVTFTATVTNGGSAPYYNWLSCTV